MPSWPSEPHDEAEQIVAGGVEPVAADIDDRAVDQHHLHAEHVVGGDAVFQAMRAAGIHADIAADGAGELRATDRAHRRSRRPTTASEMARLVTPACTRAVRSA